MFRLFLCSIVSLFGALYGTQPSSWGQEKWMEWSKQSFQVDGRNAFVVVPHAPANGKPWIWRTEFFGHEPQADIALLRHGFHVAYVDVQNLYGAPRALDAMDRFYEHVTTQFGLSRKVALEGFSRGGLFTLNWAARHPDRVSCIYNDAPVCDFKSWPAGLGKGKGSPGDWERCKQAYGLSEADALAYKLTPVDNLEPLAKANVPLLHVCGAQDDVVPVEENSLIVQERYRKLGGSFTLINKPRCGHHPHSLRDPLRIVNFVLEHHGMADQVVPATTPFGYDYFKLRHGLAASAQKFGEQKQGRVAFLGGSITAGPGWRDQVCQDLQQRFPETKFEFINAGIPSLGSTPGAFRLQRDCLSNGPVDLLFAEAAVNDDTNGFSGTEQVRGMEGIVRHALLSNPMIDIVLLHFADPGKVQEIQSGKTPEVIANHEKVAEHYQLPSIDLAKEVTERIEAGEFTWAKDFKDLHPSPFGHALYADSVKRLFNAAWRGSSPDPAVSTAAKSTERELPEPLDLASYDRGQLVSPNAALENGNTKILEGWRIEPAWKPSDGAGTRAGFVNVPALVAQSPNAALQFSFQGNAVGVFVTSGPDCGAIEYRVDEGPWQQCELFTQWSPSLHLPWAKMLAAGLAEGEHVLELRVADKHHEKSVGHAVRVIYWLVNGP